MIQHFILLLLLFAYITVGYQCQSNDLFSQYWEKKFGPTLPLPTWLAKKASPLTPSQITSFLDMMKRNQMPTSYFCKIANLACSTNAVALAKKSTDDTKALPPTIFWPLDKVKYEGEVPMPNISVVVKRMGGLPYFRPSMVKEGGYIRVPDLRDPMPYTSFLPQPLAFKIPFSFSRVKELEEIFGTVHDGPHMNMTNYIKQTLMFCDKRPMQGEKRACIISGEDLIDFLVVKVGKHARLWTTQSIEGSYKNTKVGAIKVLQANLSQAVVICHSSPFFFQVYYCHEIPKVKVFEVELHPATGKVNHAIMACHYDTAAWTNKHTAFKLLGHGPGQIEVCHWINQNGIVWT